MSMLDRINKLRELKERIAQGSEPSVAERIASQVAEDLKRTSGRSTLVDKIKARAQAARARGDLQGYAEINRICALPIAPEFTEEDADKLSRQLIVSEWYDKGFRFKLKQAETVAAYLGVKGAVGNVPVGGGKTLASLVIADQAYRQGHRRTLLLIEPNIVPQLFSRDIPWARRRVSFATLFHNLYRKTGSGRRELVASVKRGCMVMPYSALSAWKDAEEILALWEPTLIIADEAHNLKHPRAARTQRLFRYIAQHKPEVVVMSGTLTKKSLNDYAHQMRVSLREGSPVPLSVSYCGAWAQIIDSGSEALDADPGPILPLVEWAQRNFPEEELPDGIAGFRKSFRLRQNSTPGVIVGGEEDLGISLTYCNKPAVPDGHGWPELDGLMRRVMERWETPNGDEIEHAIHQFKWMRELTVGGYNELIWPTPEAYAKRKGIDEGEAAERIVAAQVHHEAQQEYHRQLRKWLQTRSRPKLDTPFLVGAAMSQTGPARVGQELYGYWKEMKDLEFPGMPERDSRYVRVCDYKIRNAVTAACGWQEGPRPGAIFWCYHQGVAQWLKEELDKSLARGCLYCPAGKDADEIIIDPQHKNRIVVASLAHATGKNLQHFQNQFWVEWPRSALTAQQGVGRLHRNGQEADHLDVWMQNTIEWDDLNLAACLNDACYVQQTQGVMQKLLYADWQSLPIIFPPEFLRERGFADIKELTAEQRALLVERFTPENENPN